MRSGGSGKRRYKAKVEQHNGSVDAHGQPVTASTAWTTIVDGWPCEVLTTSANEDSTGGGTILGYTIHGSYLHNATIQPNMRLDIDGTLYEVVAAYDPDGRRRSLKVEAKREVYG